MVQEATSICYEEFEEYNATNISAINLYKFQLPKKKYICVPYIDHGAAKGA
jgi:hypothetical protein